MEKTENRLNYIKEYPTLKEKVVLSSKLLESLKSHRYFYKYTETLETLKTDREKVDFILLELTKERSTCAIIVRLFREDKQDEVADTLKRFNPESTRPMPLKLDLEIPVASVTAPKVEMSNCYALTAEKRGLCVIVNNVEEPQSPDTFDSKGQLIRKKGLRNETERFRSVFTQLFFEIIVLTKLTANQLKEKLIQIRENVVDEDDQAFVLVAISHGQNERIYGNNACEEIKKIRFHQQGSFDIIKRDVIDIDELISIFNETNCRKLKSRPKLHFYICCRTKTSDDSTTDPQCMDVDRIHENSSFERVLSPYLDTFVSYACSKEFPSFYNNDWGMTYYGQALTLSMAQYACDLQLNSIMSKTSARLRSIYYENKKSEVQELKDGDIPQSTIDLGSFAIDVRNYAMDKAIYFNPGIAQ